MPEQGSSKRKCPITRLCDMRKFSRTLALCGSLRFATLVLGGHFCCALSLCVIGTILPRPARGRTIRGETPESPVGKGGDLPPLKVLPLALPFSLSSSCRPLYALWGSCWRVSSGSRFFFVTPSREHNCELPIYPLRGRIPPQAAHSLCIVHCELCIENQRKP